MAILTPVPAQCVNDVSDYFHIPSAAVYAIIKTENGRPGYGTMNKDGSVDWGPMQINGRWFVSKRSVVRKHFPNLDPLAIEMDPCVNVQVGTWILSRILKRDKKLWVAIGHYHSYSPWRAHQYRKRVWHWYVKIKKYWRKKYSEDLEYAANR